MPTHTTPHQGTPSVVQACPPQTRAPPQPTTHFSTHQHAPMRAHLGMRAHVQGTNTGRPTHTNTHTHLANGPHHCHAPRPLRIHLHRRDQLLAHLHVALLPRGGQAHARLPAALHSHSHTHTATMEGPMVRATLGLGCSPSSCAPTCVLAQRLSCSLPSRTPIPTPTRTHAGAAFVAAACPAPGLVRTHNFLYSSSTTC